MDAFAVCVLFLCVGFVWLVWSADRSQARYDTEDAEEIKKFSPDVQVMLWRAKCRHDAGRDLH